VPRAALCRAAPGNNPRVRTVYNVRHRAAASIPFMRYRTQYVACTSAHRHPRR